MHADGSAVGRETSDKTESMRAQIVFPRTRFSRMPKDIVSIHIGSCGCNLGNELWQTLADEIPAGGESASSFHPGPEYGRVNSPFFNDSDKNVFTPRAVFVDSDPLMPQSVNPSLCVERENLVVSSTDCRGNFFEGRSRAASEGIGASALDRIRTEVERCDNLSGFLVYRAVGGGTGSGVGVDILTRMKDEYGKHVLFEPLVYPSSDSSVSTVEPYNCIFSLAASRPFASLSLMLDNQAVFRLCKENMRIATPSFSDMNKLLARVISGCTASLRSHATLNASLNEIVTNLVPEPSFRYSIVSFSPLALKRQFSTREMVTSLVSPSAALCDVPHLDSSRLFAASLLCRGAQLSVAEIQKTVNSLKSSSTAQFVPWIPNSFKVGVVPSHSTPECVMLHNSTAVKQLFARQYKKFLQLFFHKAYVWQYLEAGGEMDDFFAAQECVREMISQYDEVEINAKSDETHRLTQQLHAASPRRASQRFSH